jgi:hypothetical protein
MAIVGVEFGAREVITTRSGFQEEKLGIAADIIEGVFVETE